MRHALAARGAWLAVALVAAASSAGAQPTAAPVLAPFSTASDTTPPPPWRVVTLPKQPRHSDYRIETLDGQRVLRMASDGGYANLLHPIQSATTNGAAPQLRWRWRVAQLPAGSDLTRKAGDDVAARVCVLFDLPLARLTAADRLAMRLGRALFDPALPAASICYVWDARLPAGTWLANAYTARVQMLVLRSAASGDGDRWVEESRDLAADFARAFPHEAAGGYFPPLAAVGVAADADNTGSRTLAHVGDLVLSAPPAATPRASPSAPAR